MLKRHDALKPQAAEQSNDAPACDLAEGNVNREYGYVSMADGTRIAYVLWRLRDKGEYPSILNYSAYNESAIPFEQVKRFLKAGYAFIGANVRGTGSSEGRFSNYQPVEGSDGAELVEWVARQPWSDGAVGMVGASYGAHTQIKVAALQPPHLRAIVPIATEGNEYREEGMPGGLFNAGLMAHWDFDVQPELSRAGIELRIAAGDRESSSIRAMQQSSPSYYEAMQHPLYDEWWRERSLDLIAHKIVVPTLLIHAWQDEWMRPNGAIRIFRLIKSMNKRLVLQNGPHALSRYEINQREQMRWLDRWVKGVRNGVENESPVTVLWEVTEPAESVRAAPAWVTNYPSWPPPDLEWSTLYLTETGRLSKEIFNAEDGRGERRYVYPLGTELVGSNEQFSIAPNPLGALSYRTGLMLSDTVLLGSPQLIFYFSSEQTDTDFMFTVKDVDRSGSILFLQRTVLRASLRAVDQQLSTQDEIVQSFINIDELKPGEIYEVRVSIATFAHVLREGHELELSILSPSSIPSPVWGFSPVSPSSVNRIYHSAAYPSRLLLPIVPAESAPAPAPELGVLRNQPYRRGRTKLPS